MKKNSYYIILVVIFIISVSCKQNEEENNSIKILFTGDLLLDRGVRETMEHKGVEFIFSGVDSLFQTSDFVICNLECPITETITPIQKRFIFRGEPSYLPFLHNAGITHLGLANNHSIDQGRQEILTTINNIADNKMYSFGAGKNHAEACKPIIISKNGIEIALFSSVMLPLENWFFLENKPCVCQATVAEMALQITEYKQQNPKNFVGVILHWGAEYSETPQKEQKLDAEKLITAGADFIVGHHPHVVQKHEIINNKPIFYSIGNFVFDQDKSPRNEAIIPEIIFHNNGTFSYKTHEIFIRNCRPEIKN